MEGGTKTTPSLLDNLLNPRIYDDDGVEMKPLSPDRGYYDQGVTIQNDISEEVLPPALSDWIVPLPMAIATGSAIGVAYGVPPLAASLGLAVAETTLSQGLAAAALNHTGTVVVKHLGNAILSLLPRKPKPDIDSGGSNSKGGGPGGGFASLSMSMCAVRVKKKTEPVEILDVFSTEEEEVCNTNGSGLTPSDLFSLGFLVWGIGGFVWEKMNKSKEDAKNKKE